MEPIRNLESLVSHVAALGVKKRLAVAAAQDSHTLGAVFMAVRAGIVEPILVGDSAKIAAETEKAGISGLEVVHVPNTADAVKDAVRLVRSGEADILMKGLVNTDVYLRAILDKEQGLLPPNSVLSHVCVVQVPSYPRLLFLTDVAVIPFPTLEQKLAMTRYAVETARRFGIAEPKVALLAATEKTSPKMPNTVDAAIIAKQCDRGQYTGAVVDGPLDVFLACDPASLPIKGLQTPVAGEADVLVFPNIECANILYKGLMLFAGGELAATMMGTTRPVTITSRSESALSKFYSVAMACLQ